MSPDPEDNIVKEITADHTALKALMSRIEDVLARRAGPMEDAAALIGELGDRLIKHFTLEEEGGYFAAALHHSPQLFARANALMEQHPKISQRIQQLTVQIGTPPAVDWWQETATRFRAFKEELYRHERAEDSLIQDAYNRDLGAND